MNDDLWFILLLPLLLFILWFGSEFRASLFVRLTLGTVFFLLTMIVSGASIIGTHLGAQEEYGRAAKRLVETLRQKFDSGDCDAAKQLIENLDDSFQPSYEGLGFPVFVNRAIESMNAASTK
jgi:hypothetical protein